jgi:hypothetical protein
MTLYSTPSGDSVPQKNVTEVSRVIYDLQSGEIVHTFHIGAPENCELPETEEVDAKALADACHMTNRPVESLGVLPLDRENLKPGLDYFVHPSEKCLLEKTTKSDWLLPNPRAREQL